MVAMDTDVRQWDMTVAMAKSTVVEHCDTDGQLAIGVTVDTMVDGYNGKCETKLL